MSSSTHQIKVKATDQTGGAFASIQKRAAAAGLNIRNMLGSAIAGASAYLGVRQFMAGVDELGMLSDVAMKASTSVDELTQAATGLGILGIKADINSLAMAFTKMAQTTGRTGMAGFYQTVAEIGKISDASKRAELTMKVFGKAGLEFMPLVNAAKEGSGALQNVIDAMPKVPQAAADAGDALSDAKTIGVTGFKNLWLEAIGSISHSIDQSFKGGVRQAALDGVAYFSYFTKISWAKLTGFFTATTLAFQGLGDSMQSVFVNLFNYYKTFFSAVGKWIYDVVNVSWDDIKTNGVFGKANDNYSKTMEKAATALLKDVDFDAIGASMNETDSYIARQKQLLAEQLRLNEEAAKAYNFAAMSTGDRKTADGGIDVGGSKSKIDNKLILGGSNDALKLSVLGPQTQEMKKQTNLLKQIGENTKQTANTISDIKTDTYTELN